MTHPGANTTLTDIGVTKYTNRVLKKFPSTKDLPQKTKSSDI